MHKFEGTLNSSGGDTAGLPAETLNDGIACKLRELYCNLENEGIPDNLLQLLDKLDAAERAKAGVVHSEDVVDG